jgi:hypothetical protein
VVALGWIVLALVFLDELLAMAGLAVYGWSTSARWLLVWLLPLLAAGHHSLAVALLVFSVVVNGLAQLPSIRELAEVSETRPPAGR